MKLNDIWYKVTYIQMNSSSDTSYDKIKHLVEIEDDIFAVFTINSKGEVNDLNIAKNIDIEKRKRIENISTNFKDILKEENQRRKGKDYYQ